MRLACRQAGLPTRKRQALRRGNRSGGPYRGSKTPAPQNWHSQQSWSINFPSRKHVATAGAPDVFIKDKHQYPRSDDPNHHFQFVREIEERLIRVVSTSQSLYLFLIPSTPKDPPLNMPSAPCLPTVEQPCPKVETRPRRCAIWVD